MTHLINDIVCYPVSEDAHHFRIEGNMMQWFDTEPRLLFLPPGSYSFLFLSKDATAEQVAMIIGEIRSFDNYKKVWSVYLAQKGLTGNQAVLKIKTE
jgi:hypothetical protein